MVDRRKQTITLTLIQLMERANRDDAAQKALERYREIEKSGGNPEILFDDFNGYSVKVDRD